MIRSQRLPFQPITASSTTRESSCALDQIVKAEDKREAWFWPTARQSSIAASFAIGDETRPLWEQHLPTCIKNTESNIDTRSLIFNWKNIALAQWTRVQQIERMTQDFDMVAFSKKSSKNNIKPWHLVFKSSTRHWKTIELKAGMAPGWIKGLKTCQVR